MKTKKSNKIKKFDIQLLEILACPEAVHYSASDTDPGKLRLYKESWLLCEASGYKYPIIDGVPILLREVGAKWKHTKESELPVPPPNTYV